MARAGHGLGLYRAAGDGGGDGGKWAGGVEGELRLFFFGKEMNPNINLKQSRLAAATSI